METYDIHYNDMSALGKINKNSNIEKQWDQIKDLCIISRDN